MDKILDYLISYSFSFGRRGGIRGSATDTYDTYLGTAGHPSAHLPLFRQTCCQRDCGIKMLLRLIPLNLLRQKQEGKRKHDLSISSYSTNSTVVFQIFPGDGIEASYLFGRQGIFLAGQNRNLIGHIRQRIGSRLQFPTLLQDIADLVTFHLHH